jgi:hypothetical protein
MELISFMLWPLHSSGKNAGTHWREGLLDPKVSGCCIKEKNSALPGTESEPSSLYVALSQYWSCYASSGTEIIYPKIKMHEMYNPTSYFTVRCSNLFLVFRPVWINFEHHNVKTDLNSCFTKQRECPLLITNFTQWIAKWSLWSYIHARMAFQFR